LEVRTAPAIFTVTGTADGLGTIASTGPDTFDASTLRAAIIAVNADAPASDTIVVPAGTYVLTVAPTGDDDGSSGDLNLTNSVTIQGAGAVSTIIDANQLDRAFNVGSNVTVNISGLSIRNGMAPPSASYATEDGGAIAIQSGATVSVINCTLTGNSASNVGGGIWNSGTLTLSNCHLSGNHASRLGGGIANEGALTLTNSTLSSNSASQDGGAIENVVDALDNPGTVTLTNSTISGNSALAGGGIWNRGTLTLSNCTLSGNSAIDGGAIKNLGALTLGNCNLSGNDASRLGGGIVNVGGALTLTNSTLSSNSASQDGGAIENDIDALDNPGTLTLTNSTLSGNSASNDGGAIFNFATLTLTNCTLSGNSTPGHGGGIDNEVKEFEIAGTLIMSNSVVAQNSAGSGGPDVQGRVNSLGFNLIGDGDGSAGFPAVGDRVGTASSPIDPRLGPLRDNGGPTFTMALLPSSPAIDAGSNALAVDAQGNPLTTDQRGFARIVDGRVDIGAFEFSPPVFLSPSDHVLYVNGTNSDDTITIDDDGDLVHGDLIATVNGQSFRFFSADVSGGIVVNSYAGRDSINVLHISDGLNATNVTINAGADDDSISVQSFDPAFDEGSISVDGGGGVDALTLDAQFACCETYSLDSGTFEAGSSSPVSFNYANIANVTLTAGGSSGGPFNFNTIRVRGSIATASASIQGGDAIEHLMVDFSAGNPIPPQGLAFDGGGGDYNSLELHGDPFINATCTATGASSGSISLKGGSPLPTTWTVSYSNVQSLIDLAAQPLPFFVTHLTFNATDSDDIIWVGALGASYGHPVNVISSRGTTFAYLSFMNRNDVTVNTLGGYDQVEIDNPYQEGALSSLTVNGGAGPNSFIVDDTASGTLTTINTGNGIFHEIDVQATTGPLDVNLGGGASEVNISPAAGNLHNIQGDLSVTGTSGGALTLYDQDNSLAYPYTLDSSSVSRQDVASITYSGLSQITLYGGSGLGRIYEVKNTAARAVTTIKPANPDDTVNVEATTGLLSVDLLATSGNPTVNVSPTAMKLDNIQGILTVAGQCVAGQCFGTITVDDQAGPVGRSYILTSTSLAWGSSASVGFSDIASLILNGTAFNDTVTVQSLPPNSVTLHGGAGANNTLIGPDISNTWSLAQPSGEDGTLDTTLVFDSFGSVIGGQSLDRFVVPDGAYIPEFFSGGDGLHGGSNNTLDLSAYTAPLTEHIMTSVYGGNVTTTSGGAVITVVRAFALCQNVIGGQGDDDFIFNQGYGLTTVNGWLGKSNKIDFSPYDRSSLVFDILGPNSGLVGGVIATFSNIQNLVGTQKDDRFAFRGTAYLDGTIDASGGTSNSLEYTQSTGSVSVNLSNGQASSVNYQGGSSPQPSGIFNFQKFVGSQTAPSALTGPDANNKWLISGTNSGTVDSVYTFTGFQKLIGGPGAAADTFFFQPGGSVTGTIDGGAGTNALDYSAYVGNITVDLALKLASLVDQGAAGGIVNITNVTGSVGNDLLVGDGNANVLIGGTGRNVLIGGAGSDTLDASRSSNDNILIGGRTDWDLNRDALDAIMAEWDRTDLGFSDRRSDLLNGSNGQGLAPLNVLYVNGQQQLILLTPGTNPTSTNGTVHADGAMDTLIGTNQTNPATGRRAHNWFFDDALDMLVNLDRTSDRENKVK
jgi:hypothetical protein